MAYEFVQGNTRGILRVPLSSDDAGTPFDLSAIPPGGVKLRYTFGTRPYSTYGEKTMTVESPATGGWVRYQFASGELPEFGVMRFEVTITDSDGKTLTTVEEGQVNVRGRIA